MIRERVGRAERANRGNAALIYAVSHGLRSSCRRSARGVVLGRVLDLRSGTGSGPHDDSANDDRSDHPGYLSRSPRTLACGPRGRPATTRTWSAWTLRRMPATGHTKPTK